MNYQQIEHEFILQIRNGNLQRCIDLSQYINPHFDDDSPLRTSITYNQFHIWKWFIDNGCSIHFNNDMAFKWAASFGNIDVCKFIFYSWDGQSEGEYQHNLLWHSIKAATRNGHIHIVKWLSNCGINIRSYDDELMREAACNLQLEVCEWFLILGADVHAREDEAIRLATGNDFDINNKPFQMTLLLYRYGADIHARDDEAFIWAAEFGNLELCKWLVDLGANIHTNNDESFKLAAKNDKFDMCVWLASLDIMSFDAYKFAMVWALKHCNNEVYEWLNGIVNQHYDVDDLIDDFGNL